MLNLRNSWSEGVEMTRPAWPREGPRGTSPGATAWHDDDYDDALLNRTKFVIRTTFDSGRGVDTYELLDPETRAQVGYASESKPGAVAALVRTAFGRNLVRTSILVYEGGGQRLSFALRELPTWWSPRVVVLGPRGESLCYLQALFACFGGGFVVRDNRRRLVGHVMYQIAEGHYAARSRSGRPIGTIQERPLAGIETVSGPSCEYLVCVHDAGDLGHGASLFMLAAAIALDIVYRDRV